MIPIRDITNNKKEQNLLSNFSIRRLQEVLGGKDMVHELHRHNFYFILVLKRGFGNHEIDFKSYRNLDYSVFIIRPGQVHKLELQRDSIGFIIEFNTDFFDSKEKELNIFLQKASAKNFYLLEKANFCKINIYLNAIFDEFSLQHDVYKEMIKSHLKIFFIILIRLRNHSIEIPDIKTLYLQERLEDFLQLLEENILHKKQVTQYATLLKLSNYQLNAITKKSLGKTASNLICEQIILESKRYLLATSHQIYQIAYILGYEDVSYFIRFFKKHTGFSPEAFRQYSK